jgi:hypothetical protein
MNIENVKTTEEYGGEKRKDSGEQVDGEKEKRNDAGNVNEKM